MNATSTDVEASNQQIEVVEPLQVTTTIEEQIEVERQTETVIGDDSLSLSSLELSQGKSSKVELCICM